MFVIPIYFNRGPHLYSEKSTPKLDQQPYIGPVYSYKISSNVLSPCSPCAGVGFSSFLPQFKDMHVCLIGNSKLSV